MQFLYVYMYVIMKQNVIHFNMELYKIMNKLIIM